MDTAPSPSKTQLDPVAALLDGFESLGGIGDDGEFGRVQHAVGLDPNGLLRWAELDEATLITLLDQDFEGVGDRAHVSVGPREGSDEWWTRDPRHALAIRSGIKTTDVPLTTMTPRSRHRLSFLRERLLDDLSGDDRIFVYRTARGAVADAMLNRLAAAMRRHGPARLLYVCPPDANHPPATIRPLGGTLLIGTLPAPADPTRPDVRTWTALCAKVREAVDQIAPPPQPPVAQPVAPPVPTGAVAQPVPAAPMQPAAPADIAQDRALVDSQPASAAHWLALCSALHEAGRTEDALASARQALTTATTNPQAFGGLGELLETLGDADAAEAAFRKAIELAPRSPRLHDQLGRLLAIRNRVAEAIDARTAAEALDPGNAGRLSQLGALQLRAERFEDAAGSYRRAAAIMPNNVGLLGQFVTALIRCGRAAEALPVAHRAAELDPGNAQRHAQLSNVQALLADLAQAEAAQRRAVALDGANVGLRLTLSGLLGRRKQFQAAMTEANAALALQPNNTRTLAQLARLAMMAGLPEQAEAALDKAVTLEPGNPGLVRQLAEVRARRPRAD